MGGLLGAKIFVFLGVCACLLLGGVSKVLIKYTGKYVNIYFNMKITFSRYLFVMFVSFKYSFVAYLSAIYMQPCIFPQSNDISPPELSTLS